MAMGSVDVVAGIHRSMSSSSRIAGLPSDSHIEATSGQLEPSRSELAQSLMFEGGNWSWKAGRSCS